MHYIDTLINKDVVICVIYFYKLKCLMLNIIQLKQCNRTLTIRKLLQCEVIILSFERFLITRKKIYISSF